MNKDPGQRITAKQALGHSWFTLEHTNNSKTSVHENITKHKGEGIFNVERIKPQFGFNKRAENASTPYSGFYFGQGKKTFVKLT